MGNDVAAQVDGESILLRDVDRQIDRTIIDSATDPARREYLLAKERLRVIDDVIDQFLFVRAATALKITVSDAEIDSAMVEIKRQNNMSDAQLADAIKAAGFTVDEYRASVHAQLLALRFINQEGPKSPSRDDAAKTLSTQLRAQSKIFLNLRHPDGLPSTLLDASVLIMPADLAAVLKRPVPEFQAGRVEDMARSARYDSQHFKAVGDEESNDFAIRVWRDEPKALDDQWDQLKSSLPIAKQEQLGDDGFSAHEGDIYGVAFVVHAASVVVLVTCGADLCKSIDEVKALATIVGSRLDRLR